MRNLAVGSGHTLAEIEKRLKLKTKLISNPTDHRPLQIHRLIRSNDRPRHHPPHPLVRFNSNNGSKLLPTNMELRTRLRLPILNLDPRSRVGHSSKQPHSGTDSLAYPRRDQLRQRNSVRRYLISQQCCANTFVLHLHRSIAFEEIARRAAAAAAMVAWEVGWNHQRSHSGVLGGYFLLQLLALLYPHR